MRKAFKQHQSSGLGVRPLVLLEKSGKKWLIRPSEDTVRVKGLGVISASGLQESIGRRVAIGTRVFAVLDASTEELLELMPRKAQVIGAKDAGALVLRTNLHHGCRVVEAGVGSGFLTVILANSVRPEGKVYAYDVRKDHLEFARMNAQRAGLDGVVEFKIGDVRKGVDEREVDAFILDIPDPWEAVSTAHRALRAGGYFASFSPNMEQVKQTTAALSEHPFVDIRTIEILEREMEVRESGTRPSFAALGHTGYLTFARKVLEKLK